MIVWLDIQVGAKLKFRVLTCDHETKKIALTHKKTMVSNTKSFRFFLTCYMLEVVFNELNAVL
jgi:hypothetical protein